VFAVRSRPEIATAYCREFDFHDVGE
jgi:hypothetical protein